ncbi:hypothetical protein RhiirC2_791668 [Rhizophagus irregularis]|uniref:Uncharacterized protein n=1 Tax=Rhizophagus irregularis TaxID=588596 RepID=A0A2N1MIS8_9GLOM|nr:hypothetical protein RhiirC2_791668 [Rhizophagus irregularis]
MTRRRSINQIMGSERIANRLSSRRFSKKRTKVPCYCDKCNGKLVITQTKMLHEVAENTTDSNLNSEEDSTTIPLNEKDNSTTPEYNENEYIFLPRRRTRSYANHSQIILEHSGTEDLSNSDYKQYTDTFSSDGNESDDETLPILLKIIHRQILNHIKRKKK